VPDTKGPTAELLARGKRQGFVSYDDVLEFLPEVEEDIEQLEDVYGLLEKAGIVVKMDGDEADDTEVDADEADDDAPPAPGRRAGYDGIDSDDTISLYLREVSRIPLLTAEQEVDLSQRIERGVDARAHLAGATGRPGTTRRAELERTVADGEAARQHLVSANSRLVIAMAKRYMNQGVPFLDLIQEGNLGLMKAADKFDWRRGHKFSTYATWWVRQAITRALADQGRTIRVPVHMSDRIRRLFQVSRRLEQELGRDPTVAEIAAEMGLSPRKVERTIEIARRPLSLEKPVGEDQDSELGEFVEDGEVGHPADEATRALLREDIERVLTSLSQREARVLELRYGLVDGHAYTLKEVGEKFGLTRERIRQIENEALQRLREPQRARQLVDYLN
jgi:RNA polymerase primary sigma factor